MRARTVLSGTLRADVETLWNYHDMHHVVRPADVGIGLGSHDAGVATCAADLYLRGMFPLIVFTGANAPTTVNEFPRGEAVHYREHAIHRGVPAEAILIEPTATNTGENISRTRDLLSKEGLEIRSAVIISRPYQQRRAYATCKKLWPEIDITCASLSMSLDDYLEKIGPDRVINMLVGDTQRIMEYPKLGFAVEQPVPADVQSSYERLVQAGYTSRLI
ncbi:YdcF family protein [Thermoactinospora rubra]|uniref:YdcF family protein n=1 Tax=Thermoactinospora rubra TaxID=1088767 RepID=UPI000A11F6AD|nr:YdcF family protein [Thermoactinospora rubra]